MGIALLIALILLNGIFAMSEIALVTARKSRLERMAEAGDKAAAIAVKLGENPTNFLSTIQIGITAIGLLSGIFGEAALSVPLAGMLADFGLSPRMAGIMSTAIVVACITVFSIIIGELVPKRIGQSNAEAVARVMARPIAVVSKVAMPFVFLLSGLTNAILRLIGEKNLPTEDITEEDIHALIADGSEAGVIEKNEHEMLKNVFRLDDRQISTLMTPRSEALYLDVDKPLDQSIETLMNTNHSRFPVCRGGMDQVLGFTSAKRLLKRCLDPARKGSTELDDILQPAVYVPETMSGMRLLEQFRDSGVKMVFVADEYGEVVGIVTIQNLLEALAGEFKPRDPEDLWAVQREDGAWLLDGLIPIPELKDRLGLKAVPEEHRGYYNTLGGMIMWLLDNMPRTGDSCVWDGWCFEVVDLDGNRIDKVLASRVPEQNQLEGN